MQVSRDLSVCTSYVSAGEGNPVVVLGHRTMEQSHSIGQPERSRAAAEAVRDEGPGCRDSVAISLADRTSGDGLTVLLLFPFNVTG
ncbi:unnamed protein product [Gadus morhua 'NCC']